MGSFGRIIQRISGGVGGKLYVSLCKLHNERGGGEYSSYMDILTFCAENFFVSAETNCKVHLESRACDDRLSVSLDNLQELFGGQCCS